MKKNLINTIVSDDKPDVAINRLPPNITTYFINLIGNFIVVITSAVNFGRTKLINYLTIVSLDILDVT